MDVNDRLDGSYITTMRGAWYVKFVHPYVHTLEIVLYSLSCAQIVQTIMMPCVSLIIIIMTIIIGVIIMHVFFFFFNISPCPCRSQLRALHCQFRRSSRCMSRTRRCVLSGTSVCVCACVYVGILGSGYLLCCGWFVVCCSLDFFSFFYAVLHHIITVVNEASDDG